MTWGSPAEFFAMGGYAPYVWGSYAVAALAIAAELVCLAGRRRTALRRLDRNLNAAERLKAGEPRA